jgi:hypothetical protein
MRSSLVALLLASASSAAQAQATYGPRVPVGPDRAITCSAVSVRVTPGQNVQNVVNANPAGTAYCFAAGTYVRQSVVPKTGDTYTGSIGTVFDGQGTTDHAFYGGTSGTAGERVTIQNFVIQNYRTGGACTTADHSGCQRGAIDNRGYTGSTKAGAAWIIKNNEIKTANGVGISANVGTHVIANYLHHNGQEGYICGAQNLNNEGPGIVIADNIVANNNPNGAIDWGWEAGGGKCWRTVDLQVLHNEAYGNWGPGLWTDTENRGTVYDGNYAHDNFYHGIFHEVSWDAVISNNRLWNNSGNKGGCGWGNCSAVRISNSGGAGDKTIEIFGNDIKIGPNGAGITYSRQNRPDCPTCETRNVHSHHNTIDYTNKTGSDGATGAVQDVNDNAIFTSNGNTFDYDTYIGLTGQQGPFWWMNGARSLAEFQAYGQETHKPEPPQPEPPTDTIPSGALIIVPPPCPAGYVVTGASCQKVQP